MMINTEKSVELILLKEKCRSTEVVKVDENSLCVGDHLVASRVIYTHHGVYIGDGLIVHYSGFANEMKRGKIEVTNIDDFYQTSQIFKKKHPNKKFSDEEIVNRAMSRLGEDWYNLLLNNCEHFANWCISGESKSDQVDSAEKMINLAVEKINGFEDENDGKFGPTSPIPKGRRIPTIPTDDGKINFPTIDTRSKFPISDGQLVIKEAPTFVKASSSLASTVTSAAATSSSASSAVGTMAAIGTAGAVAASVAGTGGAVLAGVAGAAAAPAVVAVAAVAAVGYSVKSVYDWIFD